MRLDPLFDLELSYRNTTLISGLFLLVKPYGSNEGSGYGEGDGSVSGPEIKGTLRWVNHPHSRSDGVMQPDAHGVILTDDGATLLFSLHGYTIFVGDVGRQTLQMRIETETERFKWLNSALCVVEGLIDITQSSGQMKAHVYVCVNELE